jgi:hypothetical protein
MPPQLRPNPNAPDPTAGILFSKWSGLKNTVDAERLGPEEFELAINMDLDDVGQPHRRRGYSLANSGIWSSLFEDDDGRVFGVQNGNLVLINPDFSSVVLQSGFPIPGPLMAWVQVGPTIYFSSRTNAGKINRDTLEVTPWSGPNLSPPLAEGTPILVGGLPIVPPNPPTIVPPTNNFWYSPVVNPTATLPPIRGKLLGPPPLATCLGYFNGRIYLAQGRTVWWTELYLYDYVDKTKDYWQFEAEVTMIGPVTDGIYVGTKEGVWFISRKFTMEARDMSATRTRVMDFGVIPGSMVKVPSELANPPQIPLQQDQPVRMAIIFMTTEGYCGGQDSGVCYNYSESKFIFPRAIQAAAMFRRQDGVNQYVSVLDSEGGPADNARIGSYVDAVLLKKGSWSTVKDHARMNDSASATIISG